MTELEMHNNGRDKMISVYVREIEQLAGTFLGRFSASDLRQLPDLFRTFDTHVFDDPDIIGPCTFSAAQFVSNETGAFFEIIIALRRIRPRADESVDGG